MVPEGKYTVGVRIAVTHFASEMRNARKHMYPPEHISVGRHARPELGGELGEADDGSADGGDEVGTALGTEVGSKFEKVKFEITPFQPPIPPEPE